jgi:hypothetical protein
MRSAVTCQELTDGNKGMYFFFIFQIFFQKNLKIFGFAEGAFALPVRAKQSDFGKVPRPACPLNLRRLLGRGGT